VDYDDYQVNDAPGFLSKPNGTLWNRVTGTIKNAIGATARAAVKARFASTATVDTLVWLLEDRNLDPAWRETSLSVRARIKAAWSTWEKAGTKAAMTEALELAGFTSFQVNDQADDGSLQWWEFDLIVYPPLPWTDISKSDGLWDDAGVWEDGGSWAQAAPPEIIARLRLIARKWKPTHARCRRIVIFHLAAGETWDVTAPPGLWDEPNSLWNDDFSYISP